MGKIDISTLKLTEDQLEVYKESMTSIKKHKQAAIHLVTSGGKSYILAKILFDLNEKAKKLNKKLSVLYVSTPGSCLNFLENMSDDYWDDILNIISYSELQSTYESIDKKLGSRSDFNIIVFDEAHMALAEKTYCGVKYIESKNKNAIIIAMSANNKRYDDKQWVFEWLTPKLKSGEDYKFRGLQYAVANNKICKFEYKLCNLNTLSEYCNTLSNISIRLDEKSESLNNILSNAYNILNKYNSNPFDFIEEQLALDLKTHKIDGKQGDRWFVFFKTTAEIRNSIENVEKLFKNVYNNKDIKIVVHNYYNGSNDTEESEAVLTGEPRSNTVDVILTCLKGGMSFHPKNTRGLIMKRKSGSENLISQQLGRALQIKEIDNSCKLIYDLVGNNETLNLNNKDTESTENTQSNELSALNRLAKLSLKRRSIDIISETYGDNCACSEIVSKETDKLIYNFDEYISELKALIYATYISGIIKGAKTDENPLVIIRKYDAEHNTHVFDDFRLLQSLFINSRLGEYTMDNMDTNSAFYKVFSLLGDYLYMTPNYNSETSWVDNDYRNDKVISIEEFEDIAEEVAKYNYDYNRIAHTKELKAKINRLRQLNTEGRLSKSIIKFCVRNKIDIYGLTSDIIKIVLESEALNRYTDMKARFNDLIKKLNRVQNDTIKKEETLYNILSNYLGFEQLYSSSDIGNQCINAIRIKYGQALKKLTSMTTLDDITNTKNSLSVAKMCRNAHNDKKVIAGGKEKQVFKLLKRKENKDISNFEYNTVKNEFGLKIFNDMAKVTKFMSYYNKLVADNDKSALDALLEYDKEELPKQLLKLIRANEFKESKSKIEEAIKMNTDNSEIKGIISELLFYDEEKVAEIRKLIKDNNFDERNLIKYAIPDEVYKEHKDEIDYIISNNWTSISDDIKGNVINMLRSSDTCASIIVNNLIEAGLIPEYQKELAEDIVRFT